MAHAYYNENDPKAAAWLRELIRGGHIAPGTVDERSIADVRASDLRDFTQCHFFAGIGGWSYALRLAAWADDRPVWTGSCPCQPFSAAGLRLGAADERDLWPVFFSLIKACRPEMVFGEQVASAEVVGSRLEDSFLVAVQAGQFARANKLAKQLAQSNGFHFTPRWVSRVRADLEAEGYAMRFKVLGAHSVGSPNIRQRIYWLGHAVSVGEERAGRKEYILDAASAARGLAVTQSEGRSGMESERTEGFSERTRAGSDRTDGGLAHANGRDAGAERQQPSGQHGQQQEDRCACGLGNADHQGPQGRGLRPNGDTGPRTPWETGTVLIPCTDGKQRRIESGSFPLAHGIPGRVGLLRGYGNAINPWVAKSFVESYLETLAP